MTQMKYHTAILEDERGQRWQVSWPWPNASWKSGREATAELILGFELDADGYLSGAQAKQVFPRSPRLWHRMTRLQAFRHSCFEIHKW